MKFRITHLARLSYCLSGGVAITALASLFYQEGGEILAVPGIIIAAWVDILVLLTSATNEDYQQVVSWQYPSVLFFSVVLYGLSWAYTGLREERESTIRGQRDRYVA